MSLPRFSVRNPVPVNLVMMAILIFGAWSAMSLRREFFPEVTPSRASISLPYPGASPEEVEDALAIKVEDALAELKEIDEIRTNLVEGGGSITVTFREEVGGIDEAIDKVERALDSLQDLPEDVERLQVYKIENQMPVIMIELYGDVDEAVLKSTAMEVRDDLRTMPGMGSLNMGSTRQAELRIDVDPDATIRHGVSLPSIASAVSRWMSDIPGGSIRNTGGTIGVRTLGVLEDPQAVRDIIVVARANGDILRLSDIATVRRAFVDMPVIVRFNGAPSVSLTANRIGQQDIVQMARMVRSYVAGRNGEPLTMSSMDVLLNPKVKAAWDVGSTKAGTLPSGMSMTTFTDLARFVEGRLSLLLENAIYGAILVFLTLLFFLNMRAAFWVGMGLVVAFSGTLALMQWTDTTLNLLTMFGLIIVIGLLVDDAIVVCESIQSRHDEGVEALEAAISGASRVQWPVVATVLTSIVAFLPLTFIKGTIGDLMGALPIVVALALFMSLVECLLMLPGHMGHSLLRRGRKVPSGFAGKFRRFEIKRDRVIFDRIVPEYRRILAVMLRCRYLTLAVSIALLVTSMGFLAGGRIPYVFLPNDDAESVMIKFELPVGTPIEQTKSVAELVERAVQSQPEVRTVNSIVGASMDMESNMGSSFSTHVAQFFVEMQPAETRERNAAAVMTSVRESLADRLHGVQSFSVQEMTGGPGGKDITLYITGDDVDRMLAIAGRMKDDLATFAGVHDISDDLFDGQRELQIRLKPSGTALGFTVANIAQQVRASVFGQKAHVFADAGEDIDVRVTAEGVSSGSLSGIETMWVIADDGRAVPLSEVASIQDGGGYAGIRRRNRSRSMSVTAETAEGLSPELVMASLPLESWQRDFPDLDITLGGRQQSQSRAFASLPLGYMAALCMIYGVLAWLFRSYTLPLTVMLGIPFAIIGVIWGHFVMGYALTFLSIIGFVALSGIVVNDSLILVHYYQDERARGESVFDALISAGGARLRPIFLTTITTVLGLTPLMLEQSFQARFLVPMAIAIAFGLMSATVLILLLLPCLIMILDDMRKCCYFCWYGRPRPLITTTAPR